jgi:hypothetical protein
VRPGPDPGRASSDLWRCSALPGARQAAGPPRERSSGHTPSHIVGRGRGRKVTPQAGAPRGWTSHVRGGGSGPELPEGREDGGAVSSSRILDPRGAGGAHAMARDAHPPVPRPKGETQDGPAPGAYALHGRLCTRARHPHPPPSPIPEAVRSEAR